MTCNNCACYPCQCYEIKMYEEKTTNTAAYAPREVEKLFDKDIEAGIKFDDGKARPDLLPPLALIEISKVLKVGADKYSDDNWRQVEPFEKRYKAAFMRHVLAYLAGTTADEETGLHVLAHVACCVLFLLEKELENG